MKGYQFLCATFVVAVLGSLMLTGGSAFADSTGEDATIYYSGGDIIISQMSFVVVSENGVTGPVNVISDTSEKATAKVSVEFKNIGTTPLFIPAIGSAGTTQGISLLCNTPKVSGGFLAQMPKSALYKGKYLLQGETVQGTFDIAGEYLAMGTTSYLRCTIVSLQQQGWSSPSPSDAQRTYTLFETNGKNNQFNLVLAYGGKPGVIQLTSEANVSTGNSIPAMSPNELAIEKNIDAIRQRAKKVVALRQKQWQKDYPLFMTSCSALGLLNNDLQACGGKYQDALADSYELFSGAGGSGDWTKTNVKKSISSATKWIAQMKGLMMKYKKTTDRDDYMDISGSATILRLELIKIQYQSLLPYVK